MTPRIPQVTAKLLCNILDISIFHEYVSILPYWGNESGLPVSCEKPPKVYK